MMGHWMNWPTHICYIASSSNDMSKVNSANPEVIVILGGGGRKGALQITAEYQRQDLSPNSMERLRYGARLAK